MKYYLRYGLDPYCEPTGDKVTLEGVEFIEIGPGVSRMGSTSQAYRGDWIGKLCKPFRLPWGKKPEASCEMPVHWVEFRHGFWIATTEITNAQYGRFAQDHEPGEGSEGDDLPVVDVSWHDAKAYCEWITRESGRPIRLPSEAEWECACRAGSNDEFTFGDDEADLGTYAWFDEKANVRVHPVGTKRPNRWGLFDLHGNVWEWCEDSIHFSYGLAPSDGSPWVDETIKARVYRGGGGRDSAGDCRSACRNWGEPENSGWYFGFRPAFGNPEEE